MCCPIARIKYLLVDPTTSPLSQCRHLSRWNINVAGWNHTFPHVYSSTRRRQVKSLWHYLTRCSVISIWWFPEMEVPPNHPILRGFSTINHPFWGIPMTMETTIWCIIFQRFVGLHLGNQTWQWNITNFTDVFLIQIPVLFRNDPGLPCFLTGG